MFCTKKVYFIFKKFLFCWSPQNGVVDKGQNTKIRRLWRGQQSRVIFQDFWPLEQVANIVRTFCVDQTYGAPRLPLQGEVVRGRARAQKGLEHSSVSSLNIRARSMRDQDAIEVIFPVKDG